MYSDIRTYVVARVAEVNATLSMDLSEMTILDGDFLSENQKNYGYIVKIESGEEADTESAWDNVNITIEMSFNVATSNTTNYQTIIDSYVYALMKKIRATRNYNATNKRLEIQFVNFSNLNKFTEEGTVLKPEINLKARYMDRT